MARTIVIPVTTDAAGAATETRIGVHGRVTSVAAVKGTLADTADITVTDDLTGAAVASFTNLTATLKRYPLAVALQPDGTALTTLTGGVPPTLTGRVKVVVAQGGNTFSGHVYVTVE